MWLESISPFAVNHAMTMIEDDDEFQDLMKQLHLPPEVKDNLLMCGYDCTLTFGLDFSSMQALDQNMRKLLPAGETDHSSPTCALIRALWTECNTLHTSQTIPAAQLQLLSIHHQVGMKPYRPSSALMTWKL